MENDMKTSELIAIAAAAALMLTIGCSSSTPYLDQHWGKSYEQAKYRQTLNPEPTHGDQPIDEMSGRRVVNTEDKYDDTFKTRSPRPVYNIDMPGVTGR
jgi:hypothetical protein